MREDTQHLVEEFLDFIKKELEVDVLPPIKFVGKEFSNKERSFGQFDGNTIKVVLKGRHPMDVLRTLAHEIVHQVKHHTDGEDGSDDENEANAMAGKFMREFGKTRIDGFGLIPEHRIKEVFDLNRIDGYDFTRDFSKEEMPLDFDEWMGTVRTVMRMKGGLIDLNRRDAYNAFERGENPYEYMEKYFGQSESLPDDYGASDLEEGLSNRGTLNSFFGTSPNGPEGFEVANDGVTKRAPGEAAQDNSTEDAQEMQAIDQHQDVNPIEVDIVPTEVSREELESMFKSLALSPETKNVYDRIIGAGAYDRIRLMPNQAEILIQVLGNFLNSRKYNRPKKIFADDLMAQLNNKMNESLSGDGEQEQSFERQDMVRQAPEMQQSSQQDFTAQQFFHPPQHDYSFEPLKYGFVRVITPGGNEQVFNNQDAADRYVDWHKKIAQDQMDEMMKLVGPIDNPSMNSVFETKSIQNMKKSVHNMSQIVNKIEKNSKKEKKEHPWTTKKQATRIAVDHEKEGKSS